VFDFAEMSKVFAAVAAEYEALERWRASLRK
jgi:hypothetical protein